jgi:hypothetical protein
MSRRTRSIRYGASILLVLAGVCCGALIHGSTGGTLATVLVGLGLVGVVSLVFYEVGLTEDRDRARTLDERGLDRARALDETELDRPGPETPPDSPSRPSAPPHPPSGPTRRRPDRMRGQRRRLR